MADGISIRSGKLTIQKTLKTYEFDARRSEALDEILGINIE